MACKVLLVLGILVVVAASAFATDILVNYCEFCSEAGCCNHCGTLSECTMPCNGCVPTSDPQFVNVDNRDLSPVLIKKRERTWREYLEHARKLADRIAAQP